MDTPETAAQLRRQLTAFSQFTTRSLGKADLDDLMLDACLRARAGIRVSHAKLLEYLPDRDHLLMRAGAGWKEGYVGHYAVPLRFDSAISQAFTSSQPVAVEDYSARRRDPTVQGPLNDAIQRINNLALVHDRLQFFSQMDTEIEATSLFQDLGRMLRSLLPPGVTLTIDCSGLVLSNCIEPLTLIASL